MLKKQKEVLTKELKRLKALKKERDNASFRHLTVYRASKTLGNEVSVALDAARMELINLKSLENLGKGRNTMMLLDEAYNSKEIKREIMNSVYVKAVENQHVPNTIIEVDSIEPCETVLGGYQATAFLKNGSDSIVYITYEQLADELMSRLVSVELKKRYDEVRAKADANATDDKAHDAKADDGKARRDAMIGAYGVLGADAMDGGKKDASTNKP